MSSRQGLLVVGHGSKSDDAISEFDEVVEIIRSRNSLFEVMGAHMEINTPSIPEAIDLFLSQKITDITVVPYFLFMGKHIKLDIPEILQAQKALHPGLNIQYARPVGVEPLMADILLNRAVEPNLITIL